MTASEALKILKGIEGRVIFDKSKWFFSEDRTWKEARDTVPLDSETTPKRYDIVSEGIAHAKEVLNRQKTSKAERFIDTPTGDLEAGLVRAVEYLEKTGKAGKQGSFDSWVSKQAKKKESKKPSSASSAE